ncbi:hypothetical protein Tco_0445509 [Tanacetum coccineum]
MANSHPKGVYSYYNPGINDPKRHYGFKPGLLGKSVSLGVDISNWEMCDDDWGLESKEVSPLGEELSLFYRANEVERELVFVMHPETAYFFKCLPFELPEDVENKTLQIILELQFFKLSLFDLCCHNSSKTFQQPFISAIKSYSFRLFSSLPGVLTPVRGESLKILNGFDVSLPVSHLLWSSQSFGHQKAINGFDMPLPVAVCSGLVNPLAPRKGKFHGGLMTMSTLCT